MSKIYVVQTEDYTRPSTYKVYSTFSKAKKAVIQHNKKMVVYEDMYEGTDIRRNDEFGVQKSWLMTDIGCDEHIATIYETSLDTKIV